MLALRPPEVVLRLPAEARVVDRGRRALHGVLLLLPLPDLGPLAAIEILLVHKRGLLLFPFFLNDFPLAFEKFLLGPLSRVQDDHLLLCPSSFLLVGEQPEPLLLRLANQALLLGLPGGLVAGGREDLLLGLALRLERRPLLLAHLRYLRRRHVLLLAKHPLLLPTLSNALALLAQIRRPILFRWLAVAACLSSRLQKSAFGLLQMWLRRTGLGLLCDSAWWQDLRRATHHLQLVQRLGPDLRERHCHRWPDLHYDATRPEPDIERSRIIFAKAHLLGQAIHHLGLESDEVGFVVVQVLEGELNHFLDLTNLAHLDGICNGRAANNGCCCLLGKCGLLLDDVHRHLLDNLVAAVRRRRHAEHREVHGVVRQHPGALFLHGQHHRHSIQLEGQVHAAV
mmetsp:Transcript_124629/g.399115  ORF Transcript_124629/g.399115 Transcript_124629/m.399115 type:complete len:397 (+) Transcript_124629:1560-2750(+)